MYFINQSSPIYLEEIKNRLHCSPIHWLLAHLFIGVCRVTKQTTQQNSRWEREGRLAWGCSSSSDKHKIKKMGWHFPCQRSTGRVVIHQKHGLSESISHEWWSWRDGWRSQRREVELWRWTLPIRPYWWRGRGEIWGTGSQKHALWHCLNKAEN